MVSFCFKRTIEDYHRAKSNNANVHDIVPWLIKGFRKVVLRGEEAEMPDQRLTLWRKCREAVDAIIRDRRFHKDDTSQIQLIFYHQRIRIPVADIVRHQIKGFTRTELSRQLKSGGAQCQ